MIRCGVIELKRLFRVLMVVLALVLAASGVYYVCFRGGGGPRQVVVCIDPGHPSETNSGRTRQHGTSEIEINWQVALKLEKLLAQDSRIKVVKIRDQMDQYVPTYQRALIANNAGAALALHLHCDAGPSRGFAAYYPDRTVETPWRTGPSREVLASSRLLAEDVHAALARNLTGRLKDHGLWGERRTLIGHRYGGLGTSIWSDVPTVTVEMVFLSNRADAEFIKSEAGQWEMAKALADGVKEFIKPKLEELKKAEESGGRAAWKESPRIAAKQ